MNLTVNSKKLFDALSTVGKAISARPAILPVLSHVFIHADGDDLVLAGTDLEQFIVQRVTAVVEEGGELTVPARLFTDLVKTFEPTANVSLSVEEGQETLHIECGKSKADIRGLPVQEYPAFPSVLTGGEMVGRFSPADLAFQLSQVTFAAADDESRPILTGVYVESKGGTLSFVTADGFRLAWRHSETDLADGTFVMPGKAAGILVKLLAQQIADGHGKEDVSLWMEYHRRAVNWRLYDCDLTTQLLEGNFINYHQIVPQQHTTRVVVDRSGLERLLKTVGTFKVPNVHLEMRCIELGQPASGVLRVTAQDPETGEVGGEMFCDMEGEPLTIAFNVRYLEDAIRACATDRVAFEFGDNTRPGTVKPVGNDNYLCVVMPMHLRD